MSEPSLNQHPTTFTLTELDQALKEQSFGISSYVIDSVTELEAIASIVLLEGNEISVSLTPNGFTIRKNSDTNETNIGRTFEEIEVILNVVSPKYGAARHQEIVAKLAEFAQT